jgi:cytochrome P450
MPTPPDRPDYLPLAPEQLADPYPTYGRLLREAPVFRCPAMGLTVVAGYEDLWTALKDPARFSSALSTAPSGSVPAEVQAVLARGYPEVPTLVTNDPPSHSRYRGLISKAFTPSRIATKERRIREIANTLVDQFAADGRAELVQQFAVHLPMTIIAEILGVPREDQAQFKRWSDDIVARFSPELSLERQIESAESQVEFQHYFAAKIEERRQDPRDDMVTALLEARIEGEAPLSVAEMLNMLQQLLVAGNETTTNLIGSMVKLLLEDRTRWEALCADSSRAAAVVEESLRMESPVQGLFRTTTTDVELGGVTIPKGAQVQMLYAAGNRDSTEFADPHRFDPSRRNVTTHLAFGGGPHFCIGAPLARLEGRVALEVLTHRLPTLRLAKGQSFARIPHFFLRGFEQLWVEWEAAAA